ncbi:MAG: hypothetical protein LBS45_09695 [Synergistaceae bacterium]|jgi:hypothetical protein|nr:hypothetical protein [Synergistaceae bacterium]
MTSSTIDRVAEPIADVLKMFLFPGVTFALEQTTKAPVAETDEKYLLEAAEFYTADDCWLDCFCVDCAEKRYYPATRIDPGYTDCPADGDPLDRGCVRRDEVFEDDAVRRYARQLLEEEECA